MRQSFVSFAEHSIYLAFVRYSDRGGDDGVLAMVSSLYSISVFTRNLVIG